MAELSRLPGAVMDHIGSGSTRAPAARSNRRFSSTPKASEAQPAAAAMKQPRQSAPPAPFCRPAGTTPSPFANRMASGAECPKTSVRFPSAGMRRAG